MLGALRFRHAIVCELFGYLCTGWVPEYTSAVFASVCFSQIYLPAPGRLFIYKCAATKKLCRCAVVVVGGLILRPISNPGEFTYRLRKRGLCRFANFAKVVYFLRGRFKCCVCFIVSETVRLFFSGLKIYSILIVLLQVFLHNNYF